jgi:putative SOS response-associated peptidase YedK
MGHLYSFRAAPEEARAHFGYVEDEKFPPLQHVRTGGPIAIVRAEKGVRHFALVRWGFIPSWTKVIRPGNPLINARAETVLEKASFKNAMQRRRCLVPADGFYEFTRKQSFHFHRPDNGLFAFAGLWEHWMGADGSELETGVIITTEPNSVVAKVHDRMLAILQPDSYAAWLDNEGTPAEDAAKLLVPAPDDYLVAERVHVDLSRQQQQPAQMKLF